MILRTSKWFREKYLRITGSIAFLPAVIALLFFALSLGMVYTDASEWGKAVKSRLHWLSLRDADTARSIISAIAAGIISLSVFSFSMVMIILNQTASNLSNRTLDQLIGNRFQQSVLGFYIGSIVYALFLLSTIRDVDQGIFVPALSTYLLIAITIFDIFFFIYFLHYVTQSVKYETIIHRIRHQTMASMAKTCTAENEETPIAVGMGIVLPAPRSGFIQRVQLNELVAFCSKHGWCATLLHPLGTFVLQGTGYVKLTGADTVGENNLYDHPLHNFIDLEEGQSTAANYHYGFRQLMEIAVKALSPGINDPGTAVESMQSIAILLQWRITHHPKSNFFDEAGVLRVVLAVRTVEELVADTLLPIWHYGKEDPIVRSSMYHLLHQLPKKEHYAVVERLMQDALYRPNH
ncbi:DUF2254 domain-containing protein [Pseudocnuella soli]|uniref:DUF2254 domain-containing protein n=1 Tax=Pseudocnuella soli TaxID=2502779 RepID=UPI0010539B2C|nr:DUF2254 family protein [Pseudocnuella soli]